jgi:hypothetical protein
MATDYVVAAASSGGAVLLGGRQVKAVYIMVYTDRWMENYYWRPLADINSQRRAKPEAMAGFVVIVERTAPAPPKASPVNDPQPKPYVPALPAPPPATTAQTWATPAGQPASTARKSRHKRKYEFIGCVFTTNMSCLCRGGGGGGGDALTAYLGVHLHILVILRIIDRVIINIIIITN